MIDAMETVLHRDLAEFVAAAGPLYRADPVMHTVALTVMEQPFEFHTLLTAHHGGEVVGAALRTPPWPLNVSGLPEAAARSAAAALVDHDPNLDQVGGPRARAEAFAEAWSTVTGAAVRTLVAQRVFRLGDLVTPSGVPGHSRRADMADMELVLAWVRAFTQEAAPDSPAVTRDRVRQRLSGESRTVLWELPDGEPVAMAQASAPVAAMSRIACVYTPPERRGHGYGSAVTAAASGWALEARASEVVLFTDRHNPISNAIYPRLGYRPVYDAVQLAIGG
jgi:predicted GNAT family acetyltransferase